MALVKHSVLMAKSYCISIFKVSYSVPIINIVLHFIMFYYYCFYVQPLCIYWDSRSSEKKAAKFMKRDTFIQMVIFKQIFHFCIFCRNFNCHTSPTSMPNFCIGFWNDIGDKKSEKNHFRVLPISRENYPCRPVFEGFELNRKTSPPFLNE